MDQTEGSQLEGINISIIQHSHRKSNSGDEMGEDPSFLKEIHSTLQESKSSMNR